MEKFQNVKSRARTIGAASALLLTGCAADTFGGGAFSPDECISHTTTYELESGQEFVLGIEDFSVRPAAGRDQDSTRISRDGNKIIFDGENGTDNDDSTIR